MHGPGYAPPPPGRPPSSAMLTVIRVLFVTLALLSCGLLAWCAMLRLAIIRRRPLDWVLFGISLLLPLIILGYIVEVSEAGEQQTTTDEEMSGGDFVAFMGLVAMAIGVPVHYLMAEVRHYQQPVQGWTQPASPYHPSGPAYGQPPTPGYGYPPTAPNPPARHPHTPGYGYPPAHTPPPQHQAPPTPPHTPATPPAPAPAEGGRIDQVRAELDELSDYLRKEQGQ
ncbi:hypothetical protein [Streptomyces albipurpureus]|uniref:Integral membrane protein n=1 Tax=Streptomyces albipurpureus TaxID=2897419 RepID=A0ABT0UNM2_9ACTN|nr:hypothetical protein [Streptomyces sp. CWNU-1]MCM2390229.1 hypothetical protein [Streptomyces sp. CWNU-1]